MLGGDTHRTPNQSGADDRPCCKSCKVSGSVRTLQRNVEMGFSDIILYRIQCGEKPTRLQTITILWKLSS